MRTVFILILSLLASQAIAGEPMTVDGVVVSGRTDEVSVADIRSAIKGFTYVGSQTPPASLTVLDKDHMRGYSQSRDVGWFSIDRTISIQPDGSQSPGPWNASGVWLPEDKQALGLIRSAKQVYVFPIATPLDPHRDDAYMRLLDKDELADLADMLEDNDVWLQGFDDMRYPPLNGQTVGLLFRDGDHELVLFYEGYGRWVGTLDGEHLGGDFATKDDAVFDAWEHRYAQSELDFRSPKKSGSGE
jgi:hypothetical protein